MKFTLFACGLVAIMIASTSHAETSSAAPVQAPSTITAPATAASTGYVGPSSLQLMTAQQVQASALDNQHIRLQGRISAHAHGKKYTFTDVMTTHLGSAVTASPLVTRSNVLEVHAGYIYRF